MTTFQASEERSCAMLAYTQASKADNVAKEVRVDFLRRIYQFYHTNKIYSIFKAFNEAELARIQARLAKLRSDE